MQATILDELNQLRAETQRLQAENSALKTELAQVRQSAPMNDQEVAILREYRLLREPFRRDFAIRWLAQIRAPEKKWITLITKTGQSPRFLLFDAH